MVTLPDHFNKILNDKYVSGQCCDTRIMEVIETGGMYSTRTTTDESFFFFSFFLHHQKRYWCSIHGTPMVCSLVICIHDHVRSSSIQYTSQQHRLFLFMRHFALSWQLAGTIIPSLMHPILPDYTCRETMMVLCTFISNGFPCSFPMSLPAKGLLSLILLA